jgi:hypothetical protein
VRDETRKAVEMTRQEAFKRRIRARMEKTGERYGAARRVLIEGSRKSERRSWVAEPETGDEALRAATGRGWDEWCDILDAWPGHSGGHTAIANYVRDEHGVDGWWAQTVTVGYERITGLRLPYQRPNGTFSAGKSRTVRADAAILRMMLLDDGDRADLFPGFDTEVRSRPGTKVVRIAIGPGTAQITLDDVSDGRTKVSIAHEGLPSFDDVERWKTYWSEWLAAVDES